MTEARRYWAQCCTCHLKWISAYHNGKVDATPKCPGCGGVGEINFADEVTEEEWKELNC